MCGDNCEKVRKDQGSTACFGLLVPDPRLLQKNAMSQSVPTMMMRLPSTTYGRLLMIVQHLAPNITILKKSLQNIDASSMEYMPPHNEDLLANQQVEILVDNQQDFNLFQLVFSDKICFPCTIVELCGVLPTREQFQIEQHSVNAIAHFSKPIIAADAAEDELDILVRRAEEMRIQEELAEKGQLKQASNQTFETVKYLPHLIVPTYVEESTRAGMESRERRRQRIKILYDVQTTRAQTPAFLDVSQDDPKTPLAFRYIRIILTTAEARKAQDIHLDQYSANCMSIVFATQLGVTGKLVLKGAIVQSIIYYIAFYDLLSAGKPMPGAVRDYSLKIKVRSHDFLQGTFNVYRVNCIRTNHELGLYHIVMRTLQN